MFLSLRSTTTSGIRRLSSTIAASSGSEVATTTIAEEAHPATRTHTVNVSNLRPRHRIIASGGIPPVEFEWENERSARRERFGKYGIRSGVSLGSLWPTVEEVEEEYAVGLFREYNTAVAEMTAMKEKREADEKARLAELDKKMAKYPEVLRKFEATQVKAEMERDEKELALEKRIREIQEYFGYWMDPKDPRFEVMLQQKEQEEKKAEKVAKRMEHQKKKIAEL